jgi:hypothetical protein
MTSFPLRIHLSPVCTANIPLLFCRYSDCFFNFSGAHSSSESRRAIHSPLASVMPRFLAAETPRLHPCLKILTFVWRLGFRVPRGGLDPSSTTMISNGGRDWQWTESTARCTSSGRLYTGMTTEMLEVIQKVGVGPSLEEGGQRKY